MTMMVERILPLEQGDHLTRDEFEQRFDATPGLKKAELIDGVVYIPGPVRFRTHGHPHANVGGWCGYYCAWTCGVSGGSGSHIRLDMRNMPQPDVLMMIRPSSGGQARIDSEGYVAGAPELVIEVTSSSASLDLHRKLEVYRRFGVREYIVWRVFDEAIDWFRLQDDQYVALAPQADGYHHSVVFPGLWLNAPALIRRDLAEVLRVLQLGIASAEHAGFVAQLQAQTAGS